ncbi:DNA translocase FtsK [Vagococcus xieshaowenii]|uniref:DNA translocase FtsK n=1 Tax=Vagococcus xieshaowenii TaxID=2562451 RepID=A0AAJ5JM06_9ENTE|nr:DNA translocase FtsK [Vagococcus xieshaowenii]QCA28839.1 DNA translocase FtsK [Vagococcus xieshaowenii]TFZ43454.1 DNA translocase FtsK [Vagococcus xieshaowenii]
MANKTNKKKKSSRKTKKQKQQQERIVYFFIGLSFVLLGLFGMLHVGFLGNLIANVFRLLVGNTYQLFGLLFMIFGFLVMISGNPLKVKEPKKLVGLSLVYMAVCLLLHLLLFRKGINADTNIIHVTWSKLLHDIQNSTVKLSVGGGMLGALIYSVTYFLLDQLGSYLLMFFMGIAGVILFFNIQLDVMLDVLANAKDKIMSYIEVDDQTLAAKQAKRLEKKQQKVLEKQQRQKEKLEERETANQPEEPQVTSLFEIDNYQASNEPVETEIIIEEMQVEPPQPVSENQDEEEHLEFDIPQEIENRDYQLPPTTLLAEIPKINQSGENEKVKENLQILERTFESFGVDAKVVRASIGPSVTKYEIQPAVGVKVSKIVSLTDDLALALAAKDIRMEAPIPGKSLIGIEVPNTKISMVSFRDVIESQPNHDGRLLEVPLGRDISGQVISADLSKMPHLLIAGSTGSGKSVCINGIITSILMNAKPHEVKMMMIDPKMVELNVYNGVPHLLTPVVTNPRKAAQALQKVVQEMEKRYELFAGYGVRNMTGYNDLIMKHNLDDGENRPTLPYIVVIVDELADLMMVASNEVEDAIIRLAQMARAAGIHMILATQRPSVDVITGIIKANVPSRIAFAVSSGTDSRTIIDSNGAEKLLGRGDMLFLPMGENKPIRVQGAFISDGEVEDIVSFVTTQQKAEYREDMMPSDEPTSSNGSGESQDELYDDAVTMVAEMEAASISMLQRRFRIGYNRAARLIDEMEANGVVGPSEGSKPRKVLISSLESVEESVTSDEDLPF